MTRDQVNTIINNLLQPKISAAAIRAALQEVLNYADEKNNSLTTMINKVIDEKPTFADIDQEDESKRIVRVLADENADDLTTIYLRTSQGLEGPFIIN